MTEQRTERISIISKSSTGTILARSLRGLGFTVQIFPTQEDYVAPDQMQEQAVLFELDLEAFLNEKEPERTLKFLEDCEFSAECLLLYCKDNYLRPENLSSSLITYPIPVCYLPAPVDLLLVNKIIQGSDDSFVERHDLRNGAILMEIFKCLTILRHALRNSMVGTNSLLRSFPQNPNKITSLKRRIPREADGRLRPEALSAQYRSKVDAFIGLLPKELAMPIEEHHKNTLSMTDDLKNALYDLITNTGDVVLLSTQVLETEDDFEKDTQSFKDYLYQTTKEIIGYHA